MTRDRFLNHGCRQSIEEGYFLTNPRIKDYYELKLFDLKTKLYCQKCQNILRDPVKCGLCE